MKVLNYTGLQNLWTNIKNYITAHTPTKISDLIDDSNFVDTSNPAVASGITSAKVTDYDTHIADTDIHVTTADKATWNNGVTQSYVFRYSSTALTPSSTNTNSLLDNTDNLKVGDKVIDSSGVLFSITAIDTANSTFTIGSALVDLALDANVVHTSGVETVGGFKQFANIRVTNSIKGINLDGTTTDLNNCYSDFAPYGESKGGNIQYYYCNTDSGAVNISNIPEAKAFFLISITTRLISNSLYVKQILINSNSKTFVRYCSNSTWSSWVNETDSEYVHKSGNETIGGEKTFANNTMVIGRATDGISVIQLVNSDVVGGSANGASGLEVYGSSVSTDNKIGGVAIGEWSNNGGSYASIECNRTVSDVKTSNTIRNFIRNDGSKEFSAGIDNDCKLGHPYFRWSEVYATNYYYGSNNVEFSTKFVTTDTNQTIAGTKDFSDALRVYNSNTSSNTAQLLLKNSKVNRGQSVFGDQAIWFRDALDKMVTAIVSRVTSTGASALLLQTYNVDQDNQQVSNYLSFVKYLDGSCYLLPDQNDAIVLGSSSAKFKSINTNLINSLTPSSLGMPSNTGYVDISGYFTNTGDGQTNSYTASVNGWIYLNVTAKTLIMQIRDSNNNVVYADMCNRPSDGTIYMTIPISSGNKLLTQWFTSSSVTVTIARFIPCQGNI